MNFEALKANISEFHQAAFVAQSPNLPARKKAMLFAAHACPDLNIRNILGGSVDYISQRPELVRAAIARAYSAVETLRENSPEKP